MEKQQVITVANGTVYRYIVSRYRRRDGDLIVGYNFVQVEPDRGRFIFNVLVSEYVWAELDYGENTELDRKAISLGLRHSGKVEHTGSVELRKDTLEQFQAEDAIQGTELRTRLLKFLRSVNTIRPREQVTRHSVWYNTPGTLVDIDQHLLALVEKDWLLGETNTSDIIDGKRIHYDIVYRLNPKKEAEIDDFIEGVERKAATSLMIDTSDHLYYKLIDTYSELDGDFAFVLMPFNEDEFPKAIYHEVIKPLVKDVLGINCVIVTEDPTSKSGQDKIYSHMVKSKLIIGEVSTQNPNVMFEFGQSTILEKEFILTCYNKYAENKDKKLAFDYANIHTQFYDDPDELRRKLQQALEAFKKMHSEEIS